MKKIDNAVGGIGRPRPEPGMVQKFHFTDKNKQRMVTHPILLGGIIPFGSTLLAAKNRLDRRVSIQGNGFKPGLIKPSGIIVQEKGLKRSGSALAKFLERNRYGVFINGLFQVQ